MNVAGSPGGSTDPALTLGILSAVLVGYYLLSRIRPGFGELPTELSAALRWFDRNAGDARVLAWWDYGQPLLDHTDVEPVARGPSEQLREFVDDPDRVSEWVDRETVEAVAQFLLADGERAALDHLDAEIDYVLVTGSDLRKLPAMYRATSDGDAELPEEVLLHSLVAGEVDWELAYENSGVTIYRID